MATFKDIAEAAGVSYGTVSNVLNGRGNVSSDKIQRVNQAAADLGYMPNHSAQALRRGNTKTLAVVLPNVSDKQYTDFYTSFQRFAESAGYHTLLHLHEGSAQKEIALAAEIRSAGATGIAVISALTDEPNPYQADGFLKNEVLFVEQRPYADHPYVGFDYRKIGSEMGRFLPFYQHSVLLTEGADSYVTRELSAAFMAEADKATSCTVQHYEKESSVRSTALSLDIFSSVPAPEAVFSVNMNYANTLRYVHHNFFEDQPLDIYTMSPLFTLPENDFKKYELNYRLLGKAAAEQLIRSIGPNAPRKPAVQILPNTGFRTWSPGPAPSKGSLTMLTLDSPTALIVKNMARMYTRYTGVPVKVAVFPYDGIHELLTGLDESKPFDIIRLDATWMSWFAPKIFEPLAHLDPKVDRLAAVFLPSLLERYGGPSDTIYALPETPSAQMLFYRKDLFEDTVQRRLYQEQYHAALRPPETFAEYNQIARFFTQKYNSASPVKFGSTITLGNTGVASTEFLTRYFALTRDLYDDNDHILLSSPEGYQALEELVESSHCASLDYNAWWRDTARTFAQGDVAMTVLYSNYASEMVGKDSVIRGNIGFSMVPGGNPLYGGGSIGVCRFSKQKALAYHFMKWLCGEEVSAAMTLLGSVSPCRDTYQNYQVIDTYPWLSMAQECFEKSDANRLPHHAPMGFNERRFLSILGIQVINAINGNCSPREALDAASRTFESSMA